MLEEYYAVDLHVHTPASKCFRGSQEEICYLNIIKEYIDKDVRIICITDHNTVKGYDQIIKIKKKYTDIIDTLSEISVGNKEIVDSINPITEILKIFDRIVILPGIEIEVNPGIHFVVVFNPETYDSRKVNDLLCSVGYHEDSQGEENIQSDINIDCLMFLDMISKYDCIVIAAHIDSDKGIYNSIKGAYRASIFRSPILNGIQYKNPETLAKVKSIIRDSEEYRRNEPLAYIQASDYHGSDSVFQFSYYKMSEFSYNSLKMCFDNPAEKISDIKTPEFKDIVDRVRHSTRYRCIKGNPADLDEEISRNVCAFLNSGFGSLLIGFQDKPTFEYFGICCTIDELSKIINTSVEKIECRKSGRINLNVSFENYAANRSLAIVNIRGQNENIYFIDKNVYYFEGEKLLIASPAKIENLVEANIMKYLVSQERVNTQKYSEIIKNLECMIQPVRNLKLIKAFREFTVKVLDIFEYIYVDSKDMKFTFTERNKGNGSIGDNKIFYIETQKVRLSDTYLRVTCPQFDVDTVEKCHQNEGKSVILANGGASYLISRNSKWRLVTNKAEMLILKPKQDDITEEVLIAWLKSSIVLWYMIAEYNDINLMKPIIFRNLPMITLSDDNRSVITSFVQEIIDLEERFLVGCQKYETSESHHSKEVEQEYLEYVVNHNQKVTKIAIEIDKIIYNAMNLNESDIKYIENTISSKGFVSYQEMARENANNKMINIDLQIERD